MLSRLELAKKIAVEAGKLTLRYFYDLGHLAVERKADESPVTAADRETELLLRKRIEEHFPDDAVFGEEFPSKTGSSGFQWFLDPIDGTKSFIHGVPLYSTLIGITFCKAEATETAVQPESVAGVIALPALRELIWAGKGTGAFYETPWFTEPQRARVSQCRNISEALFLTSEVKTFDETNRAAAYKNLERNARLTRTWGDAYGYAMVATGRADIMVDPALSDWDAGPLQVILEEAGGRFTDWQGSATIFGREGIGTNGLLHEAVLRLVSGE